MKSLTRGALAKKSELGIETIRFYEEKGLIPKPSRSPSGYRQYPDSTVHRLRFIRHAKELGFSLKEIEGLLDLKVDPKRSCRDVKAVAEGKIQDIEKKISNLRSIRKALTRVASACRGRGPTSECPILDYLDSYE